MSSIGRIFVVGCPRSGTTFMQCLLAAHSQTITCTESHLFDKGFHSIAGWSFLRRNQFIRYAGKFIEENPQLAARAREDLLRVPQRDSVRELGRRFIQILDDAARAAGASHWVEKTPDHVFRIPLIRSLAPEARFIHVVRPADGVLPSLYLASREWGNPKSWLDCTLHWLAAMWLSALYARGPNQIVVTYEDLVQRPEASARAILSWLGLDWEETILTSYATAADACIAAGETWKTVHSARPTNERNGLRPPLYARVIARLSPYRRLRRSSLRV